ncbi:MAG TPA: hypothetical protein VGO62_09995, partial [Myxococcota bacterium]
MHLPIVGATVAAMSRRTTMLAFVLALVLAAGGCALPPSLPSSSDADAATLLGAARAAPSSCDFGEVAVGGVSLCSFTLANTGDVDLTLTDRFDLVTVPDDALANGVTPFALAGNAPSSIAPGASAPVTVRFASDVAGAYRAHLRFAQAGVAVDVPLSADALSPPTCVIRIKSINGAPVAVGANPAVHVLDDVVLSLDQSTPLDADAHFAWQNPPQGPPTSHANLATPSSIDTGFVFDGSSVGVDAAGTYIVRAQLTDGLGLGSVNDCSLTFQA